LQGDEYEDIAAAWDWNLIPGTTVDYGATPLDCAHALWTGLESFVGGVSNGRTGAAVMRYRNPLTKAFGFQKSWFFLNDDTQYVMVANLSSNTTAPVYSVLDQKRHSGVIYVDDQVFDAPGNQTFGGNTSSLWHGGVGYFFNSGSPVLSLSVGERTGAWSAIGTSKQPPQTVDLFAAWIEHQDLTQPISYTIFPGTTSFDQFMKKRELRNVIPLQNDAHISAILDLDYGTISAVFWDERDGVLDRGGLSSPGSAILSVRVSAGVALILDPTTETLTVSDPSQTLTSVDIQVQWVDGTCLAFTIQLPPGPGESAGSSITKDFSCATPCLAQRQ